jgi:hypothetical protein
MVSLIDALDAIDMADELPPADLESPVNIGPIPIQIVSFWYRSDINKPETGKFRISIVGPHGRAYGTAAEKEWEINLVAAPASHAIVEIGQLPYTGLGLYHFQVETKREDGGEWLRVARLPLQVRAVAKKD